MLGRPQTPNAAGKGGLARGIDLLPSTASIRAVSSPATYDSPVNDTSKSKLKSDPSMFFPNKPASYACFIASSVVLIGPS